MSYANVFELTQCLEDCIAYCQTHQDREHASFHLPLLLDAQKDLIQSSDKAQREYVEWAKEMRDDKLSWKHLAKELRTVQKELNRINAIGFHDERVMYWDRERLLDGVEKMLGYLDEHAGDIDFASSAAEKLRRRMDGALSEDDETDHKKYEYLRYSKLRANGLTKAKDTIGNFRRTLRRDLTTRDKDYQEIQWPQQVAADRGIL